MRSNPELVPTVPKTNTSTVKSMSLSRPSRSSLSNDGQSLSSPEATPIDSNPGGADEVVTRTEMEAGPSGQEPNGTEHLGGYRLAGQIGRSSTLWKATTSMTKLLPHKSRAFRLRRKWWISRKQ
eukprot:GFKZ01011268.1.p2 GENE.GFKZ01011268.1~~GFKZ01011268.1.p2  ORF type:complete len:124 (+),score=5.47 GFKZ01011268.1:371-742(+)